MAMKENIFSCARIVQIRDIVLLMTEWHVLRQLQLKFLVHVVNRVKRVLTKCFDMNNKELYKHTVILDWTHL